MSVDTLHPEYKDMAAEWAKMRHTVQGNKAMQLKSKTYVPMLSEQSDEEYAAYVKRGVFFNAVGRVVDTMSGMVFRKAPVFDVKPIEDYIVNIVLAGLSLLGMCENILEEQLQVTRCGVLVDFPAVDAGTVTVAVAEQKGLRPYAVMYKAENIINWRTVKNGGKTVLGMVVLREWSYQQAAGNEFEVEVVETFRVLDLVEGKYRQRVFTRVDGKALTQVSEVFPMKSGKTFDYIPFVFFGARDNGPEVDKPIFSDLADVNIAHWRNVIDHEHGLHLTGLPTAVLTGVTDADAVFRIGSGTAWVLGNEGARATFLEFTGQGLGAMRTAIEDKKADMAALGARVLAPEKKDAEASDTIMQKRQGETSVLASLARATAAGITRVLEIMRDWSGRTGEVSVTLNTDYNVNRMTAQDVTALLQAVMTGAVSSQTFYEAMVKGEVIEGVRTFEEEQALIAENPMGSPANATAVA